MQDPKTRRDIFLSYAAEDRARAQPLVMALEGAGWSLWWDRELLASEAYDDKIEQELETSRCVVVLWSETSVRSHWVKAESVDAAKRGRLFPVLLDEVTIPLEFRFITSVDLVDWDNSAEHSEFQRLLNSLSAKLDKPIRQREREAITAGLPPSEPSAKLVIGRIGIRQYVGRLRERWTRRAAGRTPALERAAPAAGGLGRLDRGSIRMLLGAFLIPLALLLISHLIVLLIG